MPYALLLGLFFPLFTSLILLLWGNCLSRKVIGAIGATGVGVAFASFAWILYSGDYPFCGYLLAPWIHVGEVNANFSLCLDPLSLLMALIITGVGFLIHVYANGYMDHDEHCGRFFTCLNFFVFSMLLLVLAGDLLVLFIGWEGVGLASYLLIGFWYKKAEAPPAAVKAFVVNRIGDLGLLLGILLTFVLFKTTDIATITSGAKQFAIGAPIISLLTLLYFIGAMGKSAQLPLQSWLPDAMAGPTPVSALIHAATMVTAGIYLIVRLHPLFLLAPDTLQFIGVIGACTALYAALAAVAQTDLKRVLAYSTVSQLGLMFMACGAGAFYSAMFHLSMHAFVKALLFLSAGNVVHMLHGTTEMSQMGGLAKVLPKTRWLFLIGVLALSGIPPFATFFSKDLILEQEYISGHNILFFIGLAASILTAYYMMRAYLLTFSGPLKEANENVQEAPGIMLTPISVLGLLSLIGGFLGYTYTEEPLLENFLAQLGLTHAEEELQSGFVITPETWLAVGGAVLGVGIAYLLHRKGDFLTKSNAFLKEGLYFDKIADTLVVVPMKGLANFIAHFFEPTIVAGSLTEGSLGVMKTAGELQKFQSGQIRSYIGWMALGMCLLVGYLIY